MANEGKFNADLDMGLNITVDSSALTDLTKTIKEIAKGKDLQRYWSDVESATERATKAAKRYSDRQNSKGAASNFLKDFNALKAMVGGKNISELFPGLDVNELLKNAKQIAPEINSAFSVNTFSQAFKTFDVLKEKGYDLEEVFSKLADYVNLRKENFDLSRENFNYKDLLGDRDIEQLDNQVKEIKKLRNQAEDTFTKFLDINNISTTDYFGEDRFTEYFEGIRNGTMTASDAIKKFKERYDYLLEDNFRLSGDSFGRDQLQAFSEKLESIFLQVQETSNKINDIISNGIITKSVSDLSNDSSITSTQRSLFGNLLEDEESLKSITSLFQKLIEETNKTSNTQLFDTEQFTKITSLFETIESHLSSLRKVISDVGDGDEFSPLLSTIKEINSAIDSLNNTVKNTNFGTSLNLDFGDIGGKYDEQLSKAQRRKMLAYKKLFEDMRSTGKVTKESWKFVEPEGLSDDELSGIYKQMIEREKTVRGSNVFKRVIDENSKEIKNAQAAVNRARKNTENNNNLQEILGFEKTDLTGVISQLETIANKLDTIASSAKTMGDAFSSGLNVSASFEEITKLTERVKELEAELQKVKSVGGAGIETDLSSGGKNIEQYKQISKDTVSVLSDVGKTEEQIISKIQQERKEAEKNNDVLREHLVLLNSAGKVVANHWGSTSNVNGTFSNDQLSQANGGKLIHAHPGKASFFGGKDLQHLFQDSLYNQIKQVDLIWGDSKLSVDKSTLTKESSDTILKIMRKVRKTLTSVYGDTKTGTPTREAREHINAIEKEIFKSISQKLNVSVTEDGSMAKEVTNSLSDIDKAIIKKFQKVESSVVQDINPSEIIKSTIKEGSTVGNQKSVNKALNTQLSAWKGIQSVREKLSRTTDTSQIENLKKQGQLYLEEYNNAGKVLRANKELYDSHAHINKMILVTLETNNKIAKSQASQVRDQKSSVDSMVSSSQRLVNGFRHKNNVHPSDKYVETVKKATDALKEMENIQKKIENDQNGVATEDQIEDLKKYKKEIEECKAEISNMSAAEKGSTNEKATKEIKKIYEALEKNSRMSSEAKAQLHGYITELKNNPSANVEEIATAWKKVVIAEKEAGRGGKSLLSAVGEKAFYGLAGQIADMVSLWDVINLGKQAVNQVVELDTALVDLQKTTTMSSSQLDQFYYDANDVAKQMGVTTQEIIEQASAWSRLGYSNAEAATQMAQLSSQFASISPGMETNDAQEGLVSIMKAWDIGVDDVKSEIMDKINILGRCMPKHVVIHGAVAIAA